MKYMVKVDTGLAGGTQLTDVLFDGSD